MAKKVTVNLPPGTPIDKLSEDDLKKLIEQTAASAGLTGIDEVEITTGDPNAPLDVAAQPGGPGPWGRWAKNC